MLNYLRQLRAFTRDARLYLLSTALYGFALGFQFLFLNLYVLSLGYDQAFVGVLASVPAQVTAASAIPIGLFLARIGFRRSLLLGGFLQLLALIGWSFPFGRTSLILSSALSGLGASLVFVCSGPLMVATSGPRERTHLFSVQFGLTTFAWVAASLIGGNLPVLFGRLLAVPVEGAASYRAILLVAAGFVVLSLVPLRRMRPHRGRGRTWVGRAELKPYRSLMGKLVLVQFVGSLGAGFLMPFVNVFYRLRFEISDSLLGGLFAASSLTVGIATLLVPLLVERVGKIKTVVLTQLISLPFLILMGFGLAFSWSAAGYLVRTALMNMGAPVLGAFAMGAVASGIRPIAASLLALAWNAGWAVSSFASGWVQMEAGFQPIFVVTGSLYLAGSLLVYRFFRGVPEGEGAELIEEVVAEEEIRI